MAFFHIQMELLMGLIPQINTQSELYLWYVQRIGGIIRLTLWYFIKSGSGPHRSCWGCPDWYWFRWTRLGWGGVKRMGFFVWTIPWRGGWFVGVWSILVLGWCWLSLVVGGCWPTRTCLVAARRPGWPCFRVRQLYRSSRGYLKYCDRLCEYNSTLLIAKGINFTLCYLCWFPLNSLSNYFRQGCHLDLKIYQLL